MLTAEKVNGEEGQYIKDKLPGHGGIDNDESLKKMTLDPESNIPTFCVLTPELGLRSKRVTIWPDESVGKTVTPEGWLFDAVPMPSMSEPVTEGDPLAGTDGSVTMTPLLSTGRSPTGFWTCWEGKTATAAQEEAAQSK